MASDRPIASPQPRTRHNPAKSWVRALNAIRILDEQPRLTLPALLHSLADTHGAATALADEHDHLTYQGLAARASQYSHWAIAQGLGAGDVVCLMLQNCPDYVAIWLGLSYTGCAVALLNTNLPGPALVHCIDQAGPAHLIIGHGFARVLASVTGSLPDTLKISTHGDQQLEADIATLPTQPPVLAAPPTPRDRALLIYTSGTTGMPKAANVTHGRIMEWSFWFAGMMNAQATDRLYDCLPLYHSTGGIVAVGAMLVSGGAVIIRPHFSASRFWADIVAERCTIFQYIGELCRYLLTTQPDAPAMVHHLRLCCGNGLQGDVWARFQARFSIPQILEFYAATEGSVSLYNVEGKPGAIGRVPAYLASRFPIALVKYNAATDQPLRDDNGMCIPCADDEPGEALGKILDQPQNPARQFDGYTDKAASARKILHDVLKPGDRWFRTGDLMRRDAAGYYYFIDRAGDTFRWKGENVSTTEVAASLRACPGITEAVVFGVPVPGHEGRAGMAALTVAPDFSLDTLPAFLADTLPAYARPVFIRICASIPTTGTFKLQKSALQREGYGPDAHPDIIWLYDRKAGSFTQLDDPLRARIAA
ncbi:MAG: long-chain-acyl-CoA synthetase, partial [Acidocella sp.]|nr:long-chain-acyl-CoA synthetase [Acidocella sp.]